MNDEQIQLFNLIKNPQLAPQHIKRQVLNLQAAILLSSGKTKIANVNKNDFHNYTLQGFTARLYYGNHLSKLIQEKGQRYKLVISDKNRKSFLMKPVYFKTFKNVILYIYEEIYERALAKPKQSKYRSRIILEFLLNRIAKTKKLTNTNLLEMHEKYKTKNKQEWEIEGIFGMPMVHTISEVRPNNNNIGTKRRINNNVGPTKKQQKSK
tara:strand:- start:246 stop:872 length:627 start_codon:yes stop_codon:yes gene_type:complete